MGWQLDLAGVTSIDLGEVLIHGYDIAKATGRSWPIAADHARLVLGGALRLVPRYVNSETARSHTGCYDLRIRGGSRVAIRFIDGRADLEEPGGTPVDCHILAEPVALLLVLYGRIPQWGPIAKGQLLTWAAGHGVPWDSSDCSSILSLRYSCALQS